MFCTNYYLNRADAFRITSTSLRNRLIMNLAAPVPGVSAPLGFFDPLGFYKTDTKTMDKYREAELKHGRVAMTAVLGWLTQEHFHPLYDGKLSGNPLKAFAEVPPLGFVQIIAFVGLLEYTFALAAQEKGYVPGDYLGVSDHIEDKNDPVWVGFQTRELNNGRLAMIAIMGEIAHAAITGKGALEQIGL